MTLVKDKLSQLKTLPNKLTMGRIIIIPVLLILFPLTYEYVFLRIFCAGLFLLAAITDFFDGYLARRYGNESQLGALLDPIADKLLVASAIVLLTNAGYLPAFLAGMLICREMAISGMRMTATELGFSIKVNQVGKYKTAAQTVAFFCLMVQMGHFTDVGRVAIWIALGLSYFSAIQYGREFWRQGRNHFVEPDASI